ncbi:hypothetical protein [Acidovorax facilis]|uniref:hypothetical protein n=1 Tax=Acidovorax facilis TaxID=12917 RepID=UPI003D64A713
MDNGPWIFGGQDGQAFEAFGLPASLHPLLEWASRLRLTRPLLAVLDASKTGANPEYVGSIIEYLRQPVPLKIASAWADESEPASELYRLMESLSASPTVARLYPYLPPAQQVAAQLPRGTLREFALLALCVPRAYHPDAAAHLRLETFRTWTFIQFIAAIYEGSEPDKRLVEVSWSLRQAVSGDWDWRDLFAGLRPPSGSLTIYRQHLTWESAALIGKLELASNDGPGVKAHIKLLRTLRSYCESEPIRAGRSETLTAKGAFSQYARLSLGRVHLWGTSARSTAPTVFSSSEIMAEDPQPITGRSIDQDGGEGTECWEANIDERLNPVAQEHEARGVLLATIEDQQFLPFSTNRLNQFERACLENWWQAAIARDAAESLRLLGGLVWIAVYTAKSVRMAATDISFSSQCGPDWSIHPDTLTLQRLPPRHPRGWKASSATSQWLEPLAGHLQVPLPGEVAEIISQQCSGRPKAGALLNLWPSVQIQDSPESMFNEVCKRTPGLERVRSGMLAHVLEQGVFQATGDPVLGRLLASSSRSGLPGSCAYAAFRTAEVHRGMTAAGLAPPPLFPQNAQAQENIAGSELNPLDPLLREEIARVRQHIGSLAAGPAENWLVHHNAVTVYMTAAILAATAIRPVSSPLESFGQVDWDERYLFVVDKVASQRHDGRMVVLPSELVRLFQDFYLPHLRRLAASLSSQDPSLSQELQALSAGAASTVMPALFFLREDHARKSLRWFEVSEVTLDSMEVFSWPLPWNLFRHRTSTSLRRLGQDPEIIDGLLGHAEGGTATYGRFSARVRLKDLEAIRPALEQLFAALQFAPPQAPGWDSTPLDFPDLTPGKTCLEEGAQFGRAARETRRAKRHADALSEAQSEILRFVGERPVDSISADEWEVLSQRMLLNDSGTPRALGSLRYEALQDWIRQRWCADGTRPRLKKRYLPALEERTLLSHQAIGSRQKVAAALHALQPILEAMELSRTSLRECFFFGAVLTVLESRVTELQLLRDLLAAKNFRLVHFDQSYYLEHSPDLDIDSGCAVKRYPISVTAANFLARASTTKRGLDMGKSSPPVEWLKLCKEIGLLAPHINTATATISEIAQLVHQANLLEFPASLTAYLNGDLPSVGLPHRDWIRLRHGAAGDFGTFKASGTESGSENFEDEQGPPRVSPDQHEVHLSALVDRDTADHSPPTGMPDPAISQEASKKLFGEVRAIFRKHADATGGGIGRRNMEAALCRALDQYRGSAGRSCLLLVEWVRHLLRRSTRKGTLLRVSSVDRYFSSLSMCFLAVGFDHDLLACEEEDVTDFYLRLMDARSSIPDPTESSPESGSEVTRNGYKTLHLALQCLKDFHQTINAAFGVENPDWSEIFSDGPSLLVSAGCITEREYLRINACLAPIPAQASVGDLQCAFINLLMYRFGLRGMEAACLLRSDWTEPAPDCVVLMVRSNQLRRLKSPASRRQVPLLFRLTAHERSIIEQWFLVRQATPILHDKDELFPTEFGLDGLEERRGLLRRIGAVIQRVTRNDQLSPHHNRHTFANRVAELLDLSTLNLNPFDIGSAAHQNARRLLLGSEESTRRCSWAVARLLGHAQPGTTFRSYFHFFPNVASRSVQLQKFTQQDRSKYLQEKLIDLDRITLLHDYLSTFEQNSGTTTTSPLTATEALKFVRMLVLRRNFGIAQSATNISDQNAKRLENLLIETGRIVSRKKTGSHPLDWLSGIQPTRWAELVRHTELVKWDESLSSNFPYAGEEISTYIGPSRQVLMWKKEHFEFMKQVINCWKLENDSFRIFTNSREMALQKFADDNSLQLITTQTLKLEGIKLQVDPVRRGFPLASIIDRCAAIGLRGTGSVRSSHEFMLIFLISLALSWSANQSKLTT